MEERLPVSRLSSEEIMGCLSKFVHGSTSEGCSSTRELVKSALTLLQTLPATRHAVLQYIADVYDDAVGKHFARVDKSIEVDDNKSAADSSIIEDIQAVFLNVIHAHPSAWAPIISSWCLECLGDISSKYGERLTLPHSSTLNELLLVWMTCPASQSLIQITSECFTSISEADAGVSVDVLIDASVKHSPHFDWIVAHIGSCYPKTIINRVLLCGLKDFFMHSQSDVNVALSDPKLPKMASVIGILSHLATQHGDCLRDALWRLIKSSMADDATAMQLTGPVFILHLASASTPLLHATTDVFLQHVTVDVLNKLAVQLSLRTPICIRDPMSLVHQVVHLLMKTDHDTVAVLQMLLTYTDSQLSSQSSDTQQADIIHPVIKENSALVLNYLLLETQRLANARCSDLTCEIVFLRSLQSYTVIVQLCRMLVTTKHDPSRQWLFRLLSCVALHCGETCAVDVLSELLKAANDPALMCTFVRIQQDIEAKYPDVLKLAMKKVITTLVQSSVEVDSQNRLLLNLVQLCRWQTSREASFTVTRVSIIEALGGHVDSIASCLASTHCNSADVLELLCMLDVPSRLDVASLIRLSSRLVRCIFTLLYQNDTSRKFTTCQRCIEYLGRLADSNSATQSCILRLLLESTLSPEFAVLFGGKATAVDMSMLPGMSYYKLDKPASKMLTENQMMSAGTMRLMFHSGIIGQGLRATAISDNQQTDDAAAARQPPPNQSDIMHNRQLLLEALWTCSSRRSSSKESRASRAASDDTERKLSAEVAKHLAQILVELVSPDVLYTEISWPDIESVHVTIEHDLLIWRRFDENPVMWDIMDFLSTGVGAMKFCSCLLRSCTATLINQWESSREKSAKSHPKLLKTTCHVIEFMRKGQLVPEPLCYTGDILKHVSPYEVYLLLVNIWNYIKENAPLPGTRLIPGCSSRYTELIHCIIQNNISSLGHLCLLFFPPVATSSVTNSTTS